MRIRLTERRPYLSHQWDMDKYLRGAWNPALFCEMRTGKTIPMIRRAADSSRRGGRIVAAPLTVIESWENELWKENERYYTTYGATPAERDEIIECVWDEQKTRRTWLLISYQSYLSMGEAHTTRTGRRKREVPDVGFLPWHWAILDESVAIKNPQAQITKACLRGFRNSQHRAILTGLPNPESMMDIICQLLFLDGHFMGYKDFWTTRNALFLPVDYDWVPKVGTWKKIRDYVHERAFILSAADAGMISEVDRRIRRLDMNAAQKKLYKEAKSKFQMTLESGNVIQTQWELAKDSWLHTLCGGFDPEGRLINSAIADDIIHTLRGELARRNVVIWFWRQHELYYMLDRLKKAGLPATFMIGGEGMKVRREKKQWFDRGNGHMLATEAVAASGIDLSVADTMIYYSQEWSNDHRQQSMKRIIHPMKKRNHLVIDYCFRGTVSEDLIERIDEKDFDSKLLLSRNNLLWR